MTKRQQKYETELFARYLKEVTGFLQMAHDLGRDGAKAPSFAEWRRWQ